MFDALPLFVQKLFLSIDSGLRENGDLEIFDRQGWAYFADVDEIHTAMGNYRENEKVFYWVMIGPSEKMPVIL